MPWIRGYPGSTHEFCSAGFQGKRINGLTGIIEERKAITEIQKTI